MRAITMTALAATIAVTGCTVFKSLEITQCVQ